MELRSFPVLADDDRQLVEELAVGLERDAARVLAYLLRRAEHETIEDAASRLAVRVGTRLGRDAAIDALDRLEERGLATATTLDSERRGRPRKAWTAAADRDALWARVRRQHAASLLEQAAAAAGTLAPEGDPTEAPAADRQASTDEPLRVALNWTPNGLHAPLLAAAADDRYGIPVAFEAATGSGAARDRVLDGEADAAVVGAATLARSAGRLVPLAMLYPRAMAVLYTTERAFGGPLTAADQLRGRRVGLMPGTETGTLGRLFLAQAGVLSDVDVVDVDGEERAALLAGEVDAVTGMATDPPRVAAAGHEVSSVPVVDQFPFPGAALAAPADRLGVDDARLEALLAGTMAGWVAVRQDPERAARAVAERGGGSVAAERERIDLAVERHGAGDADDDHGWGWHAPDTWRRLRTALDQADLLT